jgi:hypothetical protein
LAVSALRKADA